VVGKVKAVEPRPHPAGIEVMSVVIAVEGIDEVEKMPLPPGEPTPDEIRSLVLQGGLVGLGGAAFPTHVKLAPPPGKPIDTLLINGCECEPYITVDHRQMLEDTDLLVDGIGLIMRAVELERCFIGIETNKPDAITKVREAVKGMKDVQVVPLETKYPMGSEKHLIKAVLNREIPSGGLPADVGALVHNVGTAISVAKIVRTGIPLVERPVTVNGVVNEPKNLRVRIGTPIGHLFEECGGFTEEPKKIVVGGPMMGMPQTTLDVPVVKGTSGLLALSEVDSRMADPWPCIRCGWCVAACPMGLVPTKLGQLATHWRWETMQEYAAMDCVECGSCSFTCPARIPLVQLIRVGKYHLRLTASQKKP